ncbi:flagellar basal body P-ring formation chaperone FlgA [Sporomusa malonica]|uniref:Flagella basal body P-ring formation protein FlgA n=1 Tax=Sporomusa malonica TaxID=112901 RepID=A0A1W1YRJ7_9FIRM|nr:flagellar basal body P-ring formation chaperone FlgA [Sporomusa malonica]SMC38441.1 flagella basal body P-ring formation protein FlgA [Sporomusa malonica]
MKIKLYRLTMVLLCVAGILFIGNSAKAQGLTINVAAESLVSGQYFTLGDIATISGEDNQRIDNLRQIRLGNTPAPGRSVVLTGELLGVRLSASHTDFTGISWQVPPQFRITALSQLITGQRLVDQAENYLKERLVGSDIVITPAGRTQDVLVPPGEIVVTIELPYGVKYNAPTNVTVGITVAGQLYNKANLRFDIKKYEQVAVVSRALAARELIDSADITFERRDIGRMPPGYFTDLNKILGLSVKRQLAPGTAITDSMLEKPILVKRGKTVRIVAQIGHIAVSVPGIALQNGSQGQFIRVQNANSKKMITGQVVDETTIQTHI